MRSRTGAEFRIFVAYPHAPPPASGYPVVYVLDANATFGTVTEAVRLQSARPEATGVTPAVVVGIGYPTDLPLDPVRRTFDYTPKVDPFALGSRPDGSDWPSTGGADAFLDFIEDELKPAVVGMTPIDLHRQALFGHSFGGLFTLYTLFRRPEAFQTFVAGSPSIWFGNGAILSAEKEFSSNLETVESSRSVLIAVGGLEQTPPSVRDGAKQREFEARASWIVRNRMVDNAKEMAGRLESLSGRGLRVRYEEFPGENHVSVIPPLVSRALRFALAPR